MPFQNCRFQMCSLVFVKATEFNVRISPTLCGQYISGVLNLRISMLFLKYFTGERPFKCSTCNKAFNQKGALQIHMTKHTGQRTHSCDFCSQMFAQKGNLRAHIQVLPIV